MEDDDQSVQRVKRFKHQSYKQSIKEVHAPSALTLSKFDHELNDNESHFYETLQHWRQLNLSPGFLDFANKADPLSMSMPLLLHNWKEIIDIWIEAVKLSDDEALGALLDLLQKLAHDLRTTISPAYHDLLQLLLDLLSSSLSAPALTSLLATLSALFKYLLVPSIKLDLLETTWASIRLTLLKCDSDVQRAVAEVWGSVLRRLKTAAREKAVTLMAHIMTGIEDACAWTLVFACESVSQTLHTATVAIISPLLTYHLSCEDPTATNSLFRRVLTALIHHCKSADQFSPLADLLVTQFCSVVRSTNSDDASDESLCRGLHILSVICSVRQGSRMLPAHLSQLASQFATTPITENLHAPLLKFATSVFLAGDMALSVGAGRAFILRSLEVPSFGLRLCGALLELGWGGWKLVGLPALLQATPTLLEQEPGLTIRLLASLKEHGKLGDVDVVWRRSVEKWMIQRLESWEDGKTDELRDILVLSGLMESLPRLLVKIVDSLLDKPKPKADYQSNYANAAWVIGLCMRTLASQGPSFWNHLVDMSVWAKKVIANWSWSECVLEGLVALLKSSSTIRNPLHLSEIYPDIKGSIISYSRPLRLSILRILTSSLLAVPGEQDVIKRCLQGEEVSLDMHGVRERVLRIGRVGQVVKDGDQLAADLCIRWLISQLKVNLRPLWSPACEALSSLAQRFGDQVWGLMFDELQAISCNQSSESAPVWMHEGQDNAHDNAMDDPWEEERSWRDPSAHKVRNVAFEWLREDHQRRRIIKEQISDDRFDSGSYESQLLLAMGECSSLVEKHNRDLIPLFLSLTGPNSSSRLPRQKMISWLTLFSKFNNPKALHSTDAMFSLYQSLLSHPERSLQKLSLSCMFTYKLPQLVSHEDQLQCLLDDTRWRDELTALDITTIDPPDRPQVVDILIRLLFGQMLERRGHSKGVDRRAAVLSALGGCSDDELTLLVDLMLKPMQSDCRARRQGTFTVRKISPDISHKQQVGFLTLLDDVLKNLGPRLTSCWPALIGTTIDLIAHAQERIVLIKNAGSVKVDEEEEAEEKEEEEEIGQAGSIGGLKSHRLVRQLGLKRLTDFFRSPVVFDFSRYLEASFPLFISPRLPVLDQENIQAPSGLLDLFYAWASRPEYARYLGEYDATVLPKIYDCLVATNVKPTVITRILDIVDLLLLFSREDENTLQHIVEPHISLLLTTMAILVERTKNDAIISSPLSERQIRIISEIAHHISDTGQSIRLLELLTPLLRKPLKVVSEKTKINLLKILSQIFLLVPDLSDRNSATHIKVYELLSQLFQNFRQSQARSSLVAAFQQLAAVNTELQSLATLLDSLNACSTKRLDEPDFERRLGAFATLNEDLYISLSPQHWLPIIYNMLHFIQDPDELAIRNNAAFALRHFVDLIANATLPDYETMFMRILFPGLKNGLRSKHDLVRSEVLSVIAYAVSKCERIEALQEMRPLLAGGDDEASFFTNVHHIQIHRRTRALRRLADECDECQIRSKTLAEIFVPLVEHYILSTASLDHHLVNEAINTTGRMAKRLSWGAYYALVSKYLKASKNKTNAVRVHVRTLVVILENFHFQMEETLAEPAPDHGDMELDEENDIVEEHSLPRTDVKKIEDVVNLRLLPALLQYLEKRDETEDSLRIPISIGIVNVAKHLPRGSREPQMLKLLTILSQVFRSRSQDTRDLTRDTLCRITVLLGPDYMPILLKEMRAALLRGPQLHVLAYVTHTLITHVTKVENISKFSNLDGCVSDVAHISAEVVFGESGKNTQSEDFKTKMREVKSSSSKALDSFAIMARYITPSRISSLLLPLRSMMQETESLKTMQQVEEVLRRIASGINSNTHFTPPELLVLCHTLICQNAKFLQEETPLTKVKTKIKKDDAIVQMKRHSAVEVNHYANNSFRFITFGLDLFNTAFRRSRFDFRDTAIIARLEPMVKVIGNTLYSSNHSIVASGIKAAAAIVKCPLNSIDKSVPVFVRQILDIIKQTGSTEPEVIQVALKSLATILRDSSAAQIKEKDLIFLLELLSPDLEDFTRQTAVFAMLRAIVARKFVVPEIYDIMDKVSEIMVTNQSSQVQELCRSVLLQFLLDYPQGKNRLRNQMVFLAKNLSYVYESGRKSVMELMSAIIAKFETGLVREYADLLFVSLVMVIANDDSSRCREMAAELIKSLFTQLDDEQRKVVMNHLHTWATQDSRPQLTRVSMLIYGLVVDILQQNTLPYLPTLLQNVNNALARSSLQFQSSDEGADGMDVDTEWQVSYQALLVLTKVLDVFPDFTTDIDKVAWPQVVSYLLFPHTWVRTAACRLLALFYTAMPVSQPKEDATLDHPQSLVGMRDIAGKLCTQLKSEHLDAALSLQIVKNLFSIGKCFAAIPVQTAKENEDGGDDDEESEDGVEIEDSKAQNPLPWLFSKLSYQVRSAHIARRNRSSSDDNWVHQPLSVFRWFAAMASHLDAARLEQFLPHTLTPVYRILEDDTIRDKHMEELKILATELQELIQNKVGTTKFALAYNDIRQGVLTVRRERKIVRVTQAIVNPEAAAKRKIQRNAIKKESRKRKSRGYADGKGQLKRRREE